MPFSLMPHPDFPATACRSITVDVAVEDGMIALHYRLAGDIGALVIPPPAMPGRADGLWRSTCVELFVGGAGDGYTEFNFAPSSQWAAYRFDGYRAGMAALALEAPPVIRIERDADMLTVAVTLHHAATPGAPIGLSAVIEAADGTKSYWALAHAPGPPDFHNRDCFIATLPAPECP